MAQERTLELVASGLFLVMAREEDDRGHASLSGSLTTSASVVPLCTAVDERLVDSK